MRTEDFNVYELNLIYINFDFRCLILTIFVSFSLFYERKSFYMYGVLEDIYCESSKFIFFRLC